MYTCSNFPVRIPSWISESERCSGNRTLPSLKIVSCESKRKIYEKKPIQQIYHRGDHSLRTEKCVEGHPEKDPSVG